MALAVQDLTSLEATRYNEDYIVADYYGRVRSESFATWHDAIRKAYELNRGKVSYTRPDGTTVTELRTQNVAHDGAKDLKRLVQESLATLSCDDDDELRQAVGRGYWKKDRGDRYVGKLAFDMI